MDNGLWQIVAVRPLPKSVSCSFDGHQFGSGGNKLDRAGEFVEGAERVAGSTDEQASRAQLGEVLRAQLCWSAWRMQWIRQEQQAFDQTGLCGREHGRLTSSVGRSAQKGTSGELLLHQLDCTLQAFLIVFGVRRRRRTSWAPLAKRQVTAEDIDSGLGK